FNLLIHLLLVMMNILQRFHHGLIVVGTRDGFTCETFHRLCDNIPGTVVVIKVNGTNELLGGYNPLAWKPNDQFKWFSTTDSFIFFIENTKFIEFHP
ncbi:hypothetical protein C2G38_2074650, partial [Gigaspora rosea]